MKIREIAEEIAEKTNESVETIMAMPLTELRKLEGVRQFSYRTHKLNMYIGFTVDEIGRIEPNPQFYVENKFPIGKIHGATQHQSRKIERERRMKKARMLVNDDFTGLKKDDLVDVVKESHDDVLIYKKGIEGHKAYTENNVPKVCENEECWYVLPEDIEILPRNIVAKAIYQQEQLINKQKAKALKELKYLKKLINETNTNQELRDELIECEKLLAKSGGNTKEQVRKKLQEIIGEIDDSNQEEESKEGTRGHLF